MHIVHHDRKLSRLYMASAGFWDLAEAMAFHVEVTTACRDSARSGARASVLADLTEYLAQGGAVSEMNERTAAELCRLPMTRYALVAPAALNRMRIRRLLGDIAFQIFPDLRSATAWLGWDDAYLARLPQLDGVAAPAAGTISAPAPTPTRLPTVYGRAA